MFKHGLFPSGFSTKTMHSLLLLPIRSVIHSFIHSFINSYLPTALPFCFWFDDPKNILQEVQIMKLHPVHLLYA
jgi:hypothetical protein